MILLKKMMKIIFIINHITHSIKHKATKKIMENNFHKKLETKMDTFAHLVYEVSRDFPKEEYMELLLN